MERVLVKEAEGARKINRGLSWSLLMKGGKGHSYRKHYGEKAVEEEEKGHVPWCPRVTSEIQRSTMVNGWHQREKGTKGNRERG